eukprot:m.18521 g.18521  ORF g.18521 m.18521 type:complete len:325 (+) comp8325_c0_seq1:45-1019(+)
MLNKFIGGVVCRCVNAASRATTSITTITAATTTTPFSRCFVPARQWSGARFLSSQSDKPQSTADKVLTFISYAVLGSMAASSVVGVYLLGMPEPSDPEPDNSIEAYFKRARRNANQMYQDWRDPLPAPLLPPQRPPQQRASDYTIVLDLEETLLFSQWTPRHGWRTVKRPGVDRLLQLCYQLGFEIVLFSEKEVMDSMMLMEKLDRFHVAEFKLYKGHMRFHKGELVKDLSLLNRDLSKVVLVDNKRESFAKHPHNGVCVKSFEGDTSDQSLEGLSIFLTHLMNAQPEDVREIISTFENVEDVGEEVSRRQQALLDAQLRGQVQ